MSGKSKTDNSILLRDFRRTKLCPFQNPRILGSKGGAVVRALASHQCGPGSNPGVDTICGLNLLSVLSFAPRGFSPGTPVFPSPQKPTFPNSNATRNQVYEEPLCGCATCKSLFIYLFILIPASGFILKIVLTFRKFQPQYSYKIYFYRIKNRANFIKPGSRQIQSRLELVFFFVSVAYLVL